MSVVITEAARLLRSGGLVGFPTETVYGLGADATSAAAVRRIFAAKGRPSTNPLIVHVADVDRAKRYAAAWPEAAEQLAGVFWPGPLTLVLPKQPIIVDEATAGRQTVGLRAPDHPLTLELLREFDGALAGPSANRSTHVSPTTAAHVREELGDGVDLILDGGPCRVGIESTVLDLSGEQPTILRPGGVSRAQIEAVIGPVTVFAGNVSPEAAAISPGQHEVHYAPRTVAYRFETSQRGVIQPRTPDGQPNGIICVSPLDGLKKYGPIVAMPASPKGYARHLYEVLRELDGMELAAIFIEMPPDEPAWFAIRDRLRRASTPLPKTLGGYSDPKEELVPRRASAGNSAATHEQQEIHHTFRTTAYRFETGQRHLLEPTLPGIEPCAIIVIGDIQGVEKGGRFLAMPSTPPEYTGCIYDVLDQNDHGKLATIFIEMPPEEPRWAAVRDWLCRATLPLPERLGRVGPSGPF